MSKWFIQCTELETFRVLVGTESRNLRHQAGASWQADSMLHTSRAGREDGAVAAPPSQVIGHIKTAIGAGSITRASGLPVQIKVGDPVCQGDLIETAADGQVGIEFIDGTYFDLDSSASVALNEFVCESNGSLRSAVLRIARGAFKFIAGRITDPGSFRIETPFGTLRGSARTGGIGVLSLTALIFSLIKEVQAAGSNVTFQDDEIISYTDLQHG